MTDEVISPLRRRMIEDMTIRKLAPKTQMGYIRHIKNFTTFLGRSPDSVVDYVNQKLKAWIMRKYKRFRFHKTRASLFLRAARPSALGAAHQFRAHRNPVHGALLLEGSAGTCLKERQDARRHGLL